MTRKRRSFSADYEKQIARMVLGAGLRVADICRGRDLGETVVRRWVDQLTDERADCRLPSTVTQSHLSMQLSQRGRIRG